VVWNRNLPIPVFPYDEFKPIAPVYQESISLKKIPPGSHLMLYQLKKQLGYILFIFNPILHFLIGLVNGFLILSLDGMGENCRRFYLDFSHDLIIIPRQSMLNPEGDMNDT